MASNRGNGASSAAATATKRKAPMDPNEPPSEDEMEQQLRDHAVLAFNEFVRGFHRKATERIAANRVFIDLHLRRRDRESVRYPTPLTIPRLDALQNIERVQTSEPETAPDRVRKNARYEIRTVNETTTFTQAAVVLPRVPPVPRATMWTALRKNYDVVDEPQLKFLPYFGDDDDEDVVSEYYQINRQQGTSACEVDFTKELCEYVLKQLQDTWELSKGDLKLVAKTIEVEEKVVVEVHKLLKRNPDSAAKRNRRTTAATSNADDDSAASAQGPLHSLEPYFRRYETAVDSFRKVFCRRCFIYDCDYHPMNPDSVPKLDIAERNAVHALTKSKANSVGGMARNCGNQCYLGQTQSSSRFSKSRLMSAAMEGESSQLYMCARAYLICSGNYCDMAKILGDMTCLEVAEFCEFNEINDRTLALERKTRPQIRRPSKRSKNNKWRRPSISHLQVIKSEERDVIPSVIIPCAHSGPCDDAHCSCHENGQFCSKLCACVHEDCKIFYDGCRCQRGRCRTKACPCFANGRECDLDRCIVCCADQSKKLNEDADTGDSSALETPAADSKDDTSCQNRNMGMRKRHHLRLGRSTEHNAGWGLFTDSFVAKDEFIIEYIGEMVTQEEAERRGMVYDKLDQSYLFNLNSDTVIDATRKGNKTRFINHSSKPNCYSKVINVNSDHRIGIFAARDIEPHTELFFDYRYDKELQHEHLLKQPTVPAWMKSRR